MLSGEATKTNLIVFGWTRTGLEPTNYHTRFEHANQYATDAVTYIRKTSLITAKHTIKDLISPLSRFTLDYEEGKERFELMSQTTLPEVNVTNNITRS